MSIKEILEELPKLTPKERQEFATGWMQKSFPRPTN